LVKRERKLGLHFFSNTSLCRTSQPPQPADPPGTSRSTVAQPAEQHAQPAPERPVAALPCRRRRPRPAAAPDPAEDQQIACRTPQVRRPDLSPSHQLVARQVAAEGSHRRVARPSHAQPSSPIARSRPIARPRRVRAPSPCPHRTPAPVRPCRAARLPSPVCPCAQPRPRAHPRAQTRPSSCQRAASAQLSRASLPAAPLLRVAVPCECSRAEPAVLLYF